VDESADVPHFDVEVLGDGSDAHELWQFAGGHQIFLRAFGVVRATVRPANHQCRL
jgi:hypothetical protein